jgi:hypothetical protein
MLPCLAVNQSPDAVQRNAEVIPDSLKRHSASAHLQGLRNLLFGKFCTWIMNAYYVGQDAATLSHHVKTVVLNSSEKEMVGVHAASNVASVQNVVFRRQRTAKQFVAHSVSQFSGVLARHCKTPVAFIVQTSKPYPTSGFGYHFHKLHEAGDERGSGFAHFQSLGCESLHYMETRI